MCMKFRPKELINFSILLAGILSLILFLRQGFGDSDFYWHTALGETILTTGNIPTRDIFSWYAQEQGFVETAHSWLSGVVLYLFTVIFGGDIGGGFYCILTAVVFDCILYVLLVRRIKCDLFQNIASVLLAGLTVLLFYSGRPQNIGYILYAVALYELFTVWKNPSFKAIPMLAGISLLWANFHGGSLPMLFAFEGVFCISVLIPNWKFGNLAHTVTDKKKTLKVYFGSLTASVATGLINPYGFSLYFYFFITNNAATKRYVIEWQPSTLIFGATLTTLIIVFVLFVLLKHNKEFVYTACLFSSISMTALHVRVSYYAVILAFFMLVLESEKIDTEDLRPFPYAIFMTVDAVLIAIVVSFGLEETLWDKFNNPLTEDVVEYLETKDFKRPYTDYDSGGYLINKGFKTFIDSRADLFTEESLTDGLFFGAFAFEDAEEYDRCLEQYYFDAIIVYNAASYKLCNYLAVRKDWVLDFSTKDWSVFIPASD